MPKPKAPTAPDRLALLLPWLNGDYDENYFEGRNPEPVAVRTDFPAIRRALADFVQSFDGSASAAHVVAEPDDAVEALDDEAVGDIEARLRILLDQGFGENPFDAEMSFPASSLRFAVRNAGRQKPAKRGSIVDGGVTALRNYRAPGAYVLRVQGPMLELVPFLLGHLLTAPNMASVKRCERQGCTHFVIAATAKRGRPQRFCSAACREWNREQQQRKTRRKK
jgi:hypothetical protein